MSDENPWEGFDTEGYWDVIGDGWNPGHTCNEAEITSANSALWCFTPGTYDYVRNIIWKHSVKPEGISFHDPKNAREIGERLVLLATQGIDTLHDVVEEIE